MAQLHRMTIFRMCAARARAGTNDERAYANDISRLADFLQKYKSKMPNHIFWLTTTPQHFRPYGTYTVETKRISCGPTLDNRYSRWRDDIAEPILKNRAPHVKVVYVDQPLVSRANSHPVGTNNDCTHWCLRSSAWNDHLRYILTVILSNVKNVSDDETQ